MSVTDALEIGVDQKSRCRLAGCRLPVADKYSSTTSGAAGFWLSISSQCVTDLTTSECKAAAAGYAYVTTMKDVFNSYRPVVAG